MKSVSLADAKAHLSRLVEEAACRGARLHNSPRKASRTDYRR